MKKIFLLLLTIALIFTAFCFTSFAETIKVNLAIGTNTPDLEYIKKHLKDFEKTNPEIKVNIQRLSNSASENYAFILQMLEAKSSNVDIFAIATPWNGDLAPNLADLYQFLGKDFGNKFLNKALNMCVVDGKMVSSPWNVDCGILYYRSDLLDKYKQAIPKTWIELTKTANIIEKAEQESGNKDFVGYVWQGNAYEGLTCNALEWISSNSGGTVVSEDKVITVNNPNAIKAVELAAKWIGRISPAGVLSMQEEDSRNAFQSGNAAFMRNWPYCYSLLNEKDSAVKGKFNVSTLPGGENGEYKSTISGWGLGISKFSKHQTEAAKVIEFLTSKDFELNRAIELGSIPTVQSVYQDEKFKKAIPFYQVIEDSVNHGVPCPAIQTAPYYNAVSQEFYKAVYSVLTRSTDAKSAFAELAKKIQKTTGFKIAE